MLSFIYSSWQEMFADSFSSSMTGQFFFLVREDGYSKCDAVDNKITQEESEEGFPNPERTTIKAEIDEVGMNGEMAVLGLLTNPPVIAVVKLPCGASRCPWKKGTKLQLLGELQFQTKPQLEFIESKLVSITDASEVSSCQLTDDLIAGVEIGNIKTCLCDKNSP